MRTLGDGCGKSSDKPFCDGTHIMTGFDDKNEPIKDDL